MTAESQLPPEETSPDLPDYETCLLDLADELEIPEEALSERGIQLSTVLLEMHWHEHGDKAKETYKPYHDGEHPLTVIKRSWRLLKILNDILPERVDKDAFELSMLIGAGHDVVNTPGIPPGDNERASAELTGSLMGEVHYSKHRINRVKEGIVATIVERSPEGVIIQTNIRSGSNDLLKFVAAEADINGIIMEGVPTMVNDVFNLYFEISRASLRDVLANPKGAANFFGTQAQFLENRLADVDGDLSYYFSDEEKALIQDIYQQEFSGRTRDALATARMLFRFSHLPEEIIKLAAMHADEVTVSSVDKLVRMKKHLVDLLSRSHD